MSDTPRKQHVVPSFYLAEFTAERSAEGCLWVLDKVERRQWPSKPRKASRHTDFYTGDFGPDPAPFGVERALSVCESKWAPVVRDVIERSTLPSPETESHVELTSFVAFQAMRVPALRRYIGQLMHDFSKAELLAKLQNDQVWKSLCKHMQSLDPPVSFSREELLEYARSDDYEIEVDKPWNIQQSILAAISLIPHLMARHWSLFMPEDGAPDFVCSDFPVCVTCKDGSTGPSQGFCQPRSVVTVPLGRRHALAGFFEGALDMSLPPDQVAGLNAMTIEHARCVFSTEEGFTCMTPTEEIGGPEQFLSSASKSP